MGIDFRRIGPPLGAVLLVVVGVLLIALPFVVQAVGSHPSGSLQPKTISSGSRSATASDPLGSAQALGDRSLLSTAAEATSQPAQAASATAEVVDAPTVVPPPPAPTGPSVDAYRGLGGWVDIYDTRAWDNPSSAVADMAQHGVRTLYLETSNSRSSFALKDPTSLAEFIREAHARHMSVVAWYLPEMTSPSKDYDRIAQAIGFRTPDGQKFDSFALDIESSAVKSESARNSALSSLSSKIRTLVGPMYPLGAIIPSPTGIAKGAGYWDTFPYQMVAQKYDAFVPMSYYTYHGKGSAASYADTISNVRILRAQPGCAKTPIHLIGGLAEDSSASELQAFVRAVNETKCFGASLYEWGGTTAAQWQELKAVQP